METKETDSYKDFDELGLYLTIINCVTVSFNPERTIEFNIIRPFDHSESELRYQSGRLLFKNVFDCTLELVNEYYEYPEFYRSAVLYDSDRLKKAKTRYLPYNGNIDELRHYYLFIEHGNKGSEVHIICKSHELILQSEPKFLTEFEGLDE